MSYSRGYLNSEEPMLSAREGKTLKEHVELLHLVTVRNLETVETLNKKVKALEEAMEEAMEAKEETETESEDDDKNDKNDKLEKIDTRKFSSYLLRASAVSAFFIGLGVYFTRQK
jgi:ABC-type nitrate/sulfonate/bicarbonate transport system substrate-binding protein